ncbi:MAG: class I SAM-dependent methyltransferase [Thermodesulfovibrio sp.]|nr:class I SAM-dependent methyltransferase [Thermodesulfovibrio sp.]
MNKEEYFRLFSMEDKHWWYAALHDFLLQQIIQEKKIKPELKIFDAGCGTGRACELMGALGFVSGCDISDLAVALCHRRGLQDIFQADLNSIDLGVECFDVITSMDVIYHKQIGDDSAVLGKFHRALRSDGLLVMQVPAYNWLKSSHDLAVHTARRYTGKQLSSLLQTAGFRVEHMTHRITALFLPIALYRLLNKLHASRDAKEMQKSDVVMPPALLNNLLRRFHLLENRLAQGYALPFGLSLFATARKR